MENSPFYKSSFLEAFDRKAGDLLETSLAEEDSVMDIRHEVLVFRIVGGSQQQQNMATYVEKISADSTALSGASLYILCRLILERAPSNPQYNSVLVDTLGTFYNVVEITKILGELSNSCSGFPCWVRQTAVLAYSMCQLY